jgi:hypothetical protein
MSLMALPTELQIVIAGHLTATSEQPMDDLRSLQATCSTMRHICGDPTIGRHLALDWFRCRRMWDDPIDYEALLASLTQVSNLKACFLTRIQTVFMEKHSPWPCLDDDTARRYIRRVKGEEVSRATVVDQRIGG